MISMDRLEPPPKLQKTINYNRYMKLKLHTAHIDYVLAVWTFFRFLSIS